jgi:hypothetical protein
LEDLTEGKGLCTGHRQEIEKGIKSFKVSKASPIAELHTWQNTSQIEQKQFLLLEATSPCSKSCKLLFTPAHLMNSA